MKKHDDTNKIEDILNDQYKGVRRSRTILARLFRIMLNDLDITTTRWEQLMNKRLSDPRLRLPPRGKERSTYRGNLNKQFAGDPMSFKTFNKALSFLGALRVRFTVELDRGDGKVTCHSVDLIMNKDAKTEKGESK